VPPRLRVMAMRSWISGSSCRSSGLRRTTKTDVISAMCPRRSRVTPNRSWLGRCYRPSEARGDSPSSILWPIASRGIVLPSLTPSIAVSA
jgi:hypothetical protein